MVDTVITIPFIDGAGNVKNQLSIQDDELAVAPQTVIRANDDVVSDAKPFPTLDTAAVTELTAIAASVATSATAANQATEITALSAIETSVATTATGGATATLQSAGNASLTTIAENTGAGATADGQAAALTSTNAISTAVTTGTGTGATGITQLTGGTGTLGWLSGIFAGIGTTADAAWSGSGVATLIAGIKNIALALAGALTVKQPDLRLTGQTINAATLNANVAVALNNGEGIVGWTVSGLTASGATLTSETSNDGGGTWSNLNTTSPGDGGVSPTVTVDGQFRVNAGGHTNVRLRVSTIGTGTLTIAYTASSVGSLVALSAPPPPITATPVAASGTLTLTTGGTAQPVASAGSVTRMLIIGNPSTAALQGIVTAESAFYNVTGGNATIAAGGPSIELLPGEKHLLLLGLTTGVTFNAVTTGHKISAVVA